ncbi:MCE family protein [Mycolicibacterium alvei]|uniref:Mce family protein Mce3D n=1 Tax=Mycolicibacterium alvei TaxID=67081 RepID=A0A6N4US29_9MYCO|nr:MCE family protein [Mycolicibacterium alvei]MCV7003941.1 MCE family protein [Mycolicibacterium alvei]BBX27700.1 Mce family protein Mce3D [Mycolicibacterium alvei]
MRQRTRIGLAFVLIAVLITGTTVIVRGLPDFTRKIVVTAYFDNSNGIFVGDEVRILGVPVGKIERIEPQPDRAKITFWFDDRYPVPARANAVILSPSLVTARAIQLTPAYTGGPRMADNAVIPQEQTAVPVEWDDFRRQLQRLTETLQPTQPGGVSTLGELVNTAADNLRGQGPTIRDTVIKLSQAMSALGDHSTDIFSTVKNLSILVSALQSSGDLLRNLNVNLAATTGLLANQPTEIADAVASINGVLDEVKTFVGENRETLGTTSDKLASVTSALTESLADIKQTLHVAPGTLQNYVNIYQPAQGTLSGALNVTNFANPISFLCGAVQAASRLGAEQSAKLCVQYLAPIVKNRQYNFLPFGENLFVGATARPNEVTYSEDWMRPDYIPPNGNTAPPVSDRSGSAAGLAGMMLPPAGSGHG